MNYCETCKYAAKRLRYDGVELLRCTNEHLTEDYGYASFGEDTLVYDYSEGGGFWVGPKFGCVHHGRS